MAPSLNFHFHTSNAWFSWSYITSNVHTILAATREHVTLTLMSVALGFAVSVPLALLARRRGWWREGVLGVSNVIYSIPSLAAIVALYPVFHLSQWTVVVPLAGYTLVILVRNLVTGFDGVPEETVEAARGMGMSAVRLFWQVRLPLALPAIVAGVRIATVSTIELVVIGGFIGLKGYGTYIFEGYQNRFHPELSTYIALTILLALVADLLLLGVQRALTPWQRGRAA